MATINDQSGEDTSASDQPAGNVTTPDLETIVQKAVAAAVEVTDKRFQGFQSMFDRKFDTFTREFKTAGLSPEERAQLEEEEGESEVEMLRRRVALMEAGTRFPKGVDILAKLAEAESYEAQAELIEAALAAGATPAQVADAASENSVGGDETPVPEVDRNNPGRPVTPGRVAAARGEMTDEIADAVLSQYGSGR